MRATFNNTTTKIPYKKKTIPKKLRQLVWNKHIGESNGIGMCKCCLKTKIDKMDFHCGHIVSERDGGLTELSNLLPICALCNRSMGTMNLYDFKRKCTDSPPVKNLPINKLSDTKTVDLTRISPSIRPDVSVDGGGYIRCDRWHDALQRASALMIFPGRNGFPPGTYKGSDCQQQASKIVDLTHISPSIRPDVSVDGHGHICYDRIGTVILQKHAQQASNIVYSIGIAKDLDAELAYCITNNIGRELYILHKVSNKNDALRVIDQLLRVCKSKRIPRLPEVVHKDIVPYGDSYVYAIFE